MTLRDLILTGPEEALYWTYDAEGTFIDIQTYSITLNEVRIELEMEVDIWRVRDEVELTIGVILKEVI